MALWLLILAILLSQPLAFSSAEVEMAPVLVSARGAPDPSVAAYAAGAGDASDPWREAALRHLAMRPHVTAASGAKPWSAAFAGTPLAGEGGFVDDAWFPAHGSVTRGAEDGGRLIRWRGAAGCEPDPTLPTGPAEGPAWVDAHGERCHLLTQLDVMLDAEMRLVGVRLADVGGVA